MYRPNLLRAVSQDLRLHYLLAVRAVAVGLLGALLFAAVWNSLDIQSAIRRIAAPYFGSMAIWWLAETVLFPFAFSATGGFLVSLFHRRYRTAMVLVYLSGLLVFEAVVGGVSVFSHYGEAGFATSLGFLFTFVLMSLAGALAGGFTAPWKTVSCD